MCISSQIIISLINYSFAASSNSIVMFCLGHALAYCELTLERLCASGKTYMMLGVDDSPLNLGVIPSAIAWLYRLVDERKQSTGARFSVRVSAVEVTGRHETVKDLLANVTIGKYPLAQHQESTLPAIPIACFQNRKYLKFLLRTCQAIIAAFQSQ